jgi:K+-transporting ATPase ATPase C chain
MKTYLLPSLKLTAVLIILCSVLYPILIAGIAKTAPGQGKGVSLSVNGKVVGYENIGQKFTKDQYFWGRPSAVDYNANGSGGSNKGPYAPDLLQTIQMRIDTFMRHNPSISKSSIPSELVTASGSGLDPDISPQGAYVQVARIAKARSLSEAQVKKLVDAHCEKPLFGIFGPEKVNVLKLNIDLDALAVRN